MKRTILIAAILSTGFFSVNTMAQVKSNNKPTTVNNAGSRVDAKLGQVDSTIGKAKVTISKSKEVVKDFIDIFGSRTPNEGAIVIPAIDFDDQNLQTLLKAIKDRKKEVKKASVEYADGVATIKMTLKSKAQVNFWMDLPEEVIDVFKLKIKQENNILVEYKANTNKTQLVSN